MNSNILVIKKKQKQTRKRKQQPNKQINKQYIYL